MSNTAKSTNEEFSWKEYTKSYRKRNPEKTKKWKINSAVRLLEQEGFFVVKPEQRPAQPSSVKEEPKV